jgi:hypothetical protein
LGFLSAVLGSTSEFDVVFSVVMIITLSLIEIDRIFGIPFDFFGNVAIAALHSHRCKHGTKYHRLQPDDVIASDDVAHVVECRECGRQKLLMSADEVRA